MTARHFTATSALSLVLPLAASLAGCGTDTDVSLNPKYQHGWVPGHDYELRRAMALVHETGSGRVYFEPDKEELPLGSVLGGVDSHDQVLVEHAPAATRFSVEKLTRHNGWPFAMTITTAEGRIVTGPHKGSILELFSISEQDWIAEYEIVQGRSNTWAAPVPGR
jgi:hypothetical protein